MRPLNQVDENVAQWRHRILIWKREGSRSRNNLPAMQAGRPPRLRKVPLPYVKERNN